VRKNNPRNRFCSLWCYLSTCQISIECEKNIKQYPAGQLTWEVKLNNFGTNFPQFNQIFASSNTIFNLGQICSYNDDLRGADMEFVTNTPWNLKKEFNFRFFVFAKLNPRTWIFLVFSPSVDAILIFACLIIRIWIKE
jgi:predicted carbohydrate-binding protein with CBM5 and CBM33 domain